MASTLNDPRAIEHLGDRSPERSVRGNASRRHYCTLEEMLVLVFGVMTVAYILLSLTRLTL